MAAKLCLLGCHNFQREVAAAIAAEGWPDVAAAEFPARCGRPPVAWTELRSLLPTDCSDVLIMGRACLHGLGEPPAEWPPVRLLRVQQCFHLVAGRTMVDEAVGRGAYLITPSWLADWRGKLAEMGFAPDGAGEFFRDCARELLLLDTGTDPQAETLLAELAAMVGVPARRVAVGLDHPRALLGALVAEWRLAVAQREARERDRRHARELADHVSAMDLLGRLAQTGSETEALAAIEDVFRMLFAPGDLHILRVGRDQLPNPDDQAAVPAALLEPMLRLTEPYAWTPGGQGFLLRIAHGGRPLGLIAVDQLAFPQYRERYLNLALAMTGVCALAIDNARNRQRLIEAEKMASLGILVAGVAHEINTPVGVGLTAASTLQRQSQALARRFAERSMTQSDLQSYLAETSAEAELIRSNLARIGQLVDTFRQVAIDGKGPVKRELRLRTCIDEVVAGFGGRLAGIELGIAGDEALRIESYPTDWASILTNLIDNSLKHGFKGRGHGRIELHYEARDGSLAVDYSDDGAGMAAEVRQRVFDPFFSTDLQHGMGLGMHLVYNLVTQRLGGTIGCDSRPGRGSHFRIEIPL
jgi:signal transduction histidine kinase